MRTYIYIETKSPKRGMDARISVYRVKRNQPHFIGCSDSQTASWPGAHGEAVLIINRIDRIPFGKKRDGRIDRYTLRMELGPASKHDDNGHHRDTVRLFEC